MDNWLVAVVAGAFLLGLIIGIARGAIKITVSLLATIVTFVLVFFLTPYVSKGITKMTPAQDVLETKIESTIAGMVMGDSEEGGTNKEDQIRSALKAAGVDEDRLNELGITVEDIANGSISKNDLAEMGISRNILDGINQQSADDGTEPLENIEIPRDMQISAIENADIPSVFKNLLLTNNNSEIYDKLGVTGFVSALKAAGVDEDRLNELGITVEDIANGSISKNDLAEMGISRNILDGINQQSADDGTEPLENIEIPRDMQISAIENADIPSVFKNLLLTNNNSEIYDKLGVTGFVSYVSAYMAKLIINVAAFLLTFIVVSIILRAIIFSLNVVSELPVVGLVNRLAGGVLGMLMVLIIVWLVFLVITMLYTTGIGKSMIAMIQENEFLKTIYEYNPVLKLATSMKL